MHKKLHHINDKYNSILKTEQKHNIWKGNTEKDGLSETMNDSIELVVLVWHSNRFAVLDYPI